MDAFCDILQFLEYTLQYRNRFSSLFLHAKLRAKKRNAMLGHIPTLITSISILMCQSIHAQESVWLGFVIFFMLQLE